MALGRTFSIALKGVEPVLVTIEANVGPGLPGTHVVGLADTAVSESRDRMRTAVANSQLSWPRIKVVVNLSPASLPKTGAHFDLPIAVAILTASWQEDSLTRTLDSTLLMGELGLDGSLRPVAGVMPSLLEARRMGFEYVIVPEGNAAEAQMVDVPKVLVARNLRDVIEWLQGGNCLSRAQDVLVNQEDPHAVIPDMEDINGQPEARLAAEIAAAGGHHLMMVGPPGSGKSMIAARLPGILPALSVQQCIETTCIHSIAGTSFHGPVRSAPFVAPHHSISRAALLGGGSGNPAPGAVSLAHHGVLFLDEVSEIPTPILDSLRTPLEEGQVRLVRKQREYLFPARFQLVMAANPCPCGADKPNRCRCPARLRQNYLNNLSGPVRDRIDMFVTMSSEGASLRAMHPEPSSRIADRVLEARTRARDRWLHAGWACATNAAMNSRILRRQYPAEESAMALLEAHLLDGSLSQRGVDRTLKVAWTLCDLRAGARPCLDDVARALDLHSSEVLSCAA